MVGCAGVCPGVNEAFDDACVAILSCYRNRSATTLDDLSERVNGKIHVVKRHKNMHRVTLYDM